MSETSGVVRKNFPEMLGEFLREAAVLVVVFGFLDLYVTGKAVTFWSALGIFSVSGFLLTGGILLELTPKQ